MQLFGNPLEYLPELSPATQLRSLSLANVRIMADATFTRCVCLGWCLFVWGGMGQREVQAAPQGGGGTRGIKCFPGSIAPSAGTGR